MAWSLPYTMLIVGLVAAPSLIARGVHEVTGDPLWRYLAIDEARLAAAETRFESNGPQVRVRIHWRGPDQAFDSPEKIVETLRVLFEVKGIDSFIVVIEPNPPPADSETTVSLRAGVNRYGPFPAWDSARHIQSAVKAARLSYVPPEPRWYRW